jgi:hypothetical protein
MFPDDGLEKLLGLVESLSQKIATIDQSGLLDASVLGEVVHPQNFNTLRRIEDEDRTVVDEQEQFVELVSSEFLLQNLKGLLDSGMRQMLEELPDGIHSGLMRQGAKGVFFYFMAIGNTRKQEMSKGSHQHFWRYIDLSEDWRGGRIEDNRYVITNLIACQPDTQRVVPADREVDIFALQEQVIGSIVQSSVEQIAVEEAPKVLDPIQQTIATTLRGYINNPAINRNEIKTAIQKVIEPQPGVYIKTLRKAYEQFLTDRNINELLAAIKSIASEKEAPSSNVQAADSTMKSPVKREDLKLVCFDYVW